jgi:hypothetical protein
MQPIGLSIDLTDQAASQIASVLPPIQKVLAFSGIAVE